MNELNNLTNRNFEETEERIKGETTLCPLSCQHSPTTSTLPTARCRYRVEAEGVAEGVAGHRRS